MCPLILPLAILNRPFDHVHIDLIFFITFIAIDRPFLDIQSVRLLLLIS
jgi:hypothetical protein